MGSIVKGVASLFGGKKRRTEQKIANAGLKDQIAAQDAVKYKNNWNDMDALDYSVVEGQAGTLGDPAQMMGKNKLGRAEEADLATLADAQGYEDRLQTYTGNDYSAANTSIGGLQRGANTGLTNTFNNLQVSTAGAEMAAQEADQSLAASQDLAAQAGTGAGGATALAAAAAKSKAGISADIDRQVKANEQMRAQGESELQRSQLAQGNTASKFDLSQGQFNVGQTNAQRQFGATSANQAMQFNANSANQAARFTAQSQNDFAKTAFAAENAMNRFNTGAQNKNLMAQFGADNAMEQFNVGSQNQFSRTQFGADNTFALENNRNTNQRNRDIANSEQQNQLYDRQARDKEFQFDWDRTQDQTSRAMARSNAADAARAAAKADLIGGIGGILDAGVMAASGGLFGSGAGATKLKGVADGLLGKT